MYKIKLGGIYQILHDSGYYYIGSSQDIFTRWQSHWTLLKQKRHHSNELQELFNRSNPEQFIFRILKHISKTDLKIKSKLIGKKFDAYYRTQLLAEEKKIMKQWSINYCLNKNKRHFG